MADYGEFNGERLKFARIYRGKTIVGLAEEIGVTKQAISQFEKGINPPKFETLMKIMSSLEFPREFFFQETNVDTKIGNSYFRALLGATKNEKEFQIKRIELISRIRYFLEQYIDFPQLNLPVDDDRVKTIEERAEDLRTLWGIDDKPISNIVYLMEKNGINITTIKTREFSIDAFTQMQRYKNREYYFTVLGDDKYSGARRQFSAAHELGHIILHESVVDTDEIDNIDYKQMENEANQFASAFLLPRDAFSGDLIYPNKLDFYVELKKKWRVSIAAMIMRAHQLDAINLYQYQYLMKQINIKGWKKQEPLDDMLPLQQPTVMKRAIDVILDNGVLDGDGIVYELSRFGTALNKKEIENLLGLEQGRLNSNFTKGVVIELKR